MVVMTTNTHLEVQDKYINRLVKYAEVDGGKSGAGGKSVKISSKSRKIVKESKNFKDLKNLQKPSI